MWTKSHTQTFENITAAQVWRAWTNVSRWPEWDADIEYCKMTGPFAVGNHFILKPKKGPEVRIMILEAIENKCFVDCTRFPGAKMYGIHEFQEEPGGQLRLTACIEVTGWLGWLWRKLVAQEIADGLAEQMETLVSVVRRG